MDETTTDPYSHTVRLYPHLDGHEVGSAFIGDCLGDQCFAAPRGAVQQHTSWSGQPQCGKALRVLDWLGDGKRQLLAHLAATVQVEGYSDIGFAQNITTRLLNFAEKYGTPPDAELHKQVHTHNSLGKDTKTSSPKQLDTE